MRSEIIEKSSPGFWRTIGQAVRGTQVDYTTGSLGRAIFLLSIPMVLEMVMESIFAVVDVFFVGKLGADAVAVVGLTESLMTIIYTIGMGLGIGVTATVARRIGERDSEGASRTAVQALVIGVLVSVVIAVGGVLYTPELLALMGGTPSVVALGTDFARLMLGGNVVIMILFIVNAVFRGAGDAAIAMRVLIVANFLNIVLGPCLIFGLGPFPELGVTGAAAATTIGRGTGALLALWMLTRSSARVQVTRRHLHIDPSLMKRIVSLSLSGTFQVLISTASWIGLVRIVAGFGSEALAGYTIGIRIIMFALLPSWGMSNAAATMVGQSLGAKEPERAEKAAWLAGFYNMCFLGAIGIIFILVPETIVSLFTTDPKVLDYGSQCLRVVACGFLFYGYGMVLTQAFNGAGDTTTPTWINFVAFWVFEIPLAYILAIPMGMGPFGVFLSVTLSFSLVAIIGAVLFRKGKWKVRVV